MKANEKIIMLKGLPRSGKSTWSAEYIKNNQDVVKVSRDDIREMLHNNIWSGKNEKFTMKVQEAIVDLSLKDSKTVIIDDTNMSQYHYDRWSTFAKERNADFDVVEMPVVELSELILRDRNSKHQRGDSVIVNMALESRLIEFNDDEIVLCDLDGTLCDCSHRRHHLDNDKDWKSFFEGISDDSLIENTLNIIKGFIANNKKIIFVSARPDTYRRTTEEWLNKHNFRFAYAADAAQNTIPFYGLIMRSSRDSRKDDIVKQELLNKYFDKNKIHAVIDDRPSVIRMWRENGLTVIDVGDGIDF